MYCVLHAKGTRGSLAAAMSGCRECRVVSVTTLRIVSCFTPGGKSRSSCSPLLTYRTIVLSWITILSSSLKNEPHGMVSSDTAASRARSLRYMLDSRQAPRSSLTCEAVGQQHGDTYEISIIDSLIVCSKPTARQLIPAQQLLLVRVSCRLILFDASGTRIILAHRLRQASETGGQQSRLLK